MFGNLITAELQKLADQAAQLTGLKHQLYLKADALLAEIETLSQEQIKDYVERKRAELKSWAGE